jgi:hypothetical protein
MVESSLGWVFPFGVEHKDESSKCIRYFRRFEGNPGTVKVDNEPALNALGSKFQKALQEPVADPFIPNLYRGTRCHHGAPYDPWGQTLVERWHGTCAGIAAIIAHADQRLWVEAAKWLAWNYVRLVRRSGKKSIYEERLGKPVPQHIMDMRRVFGTLCFAFIKDEGTLQKSDGTPVMAKHEVGVMLGIDHESTAWRVGVFRRDGRVTTGRWPGWRWEVIRNSTVTVCETVFVQDCEDLMKSNAAEIIFQRHVQRLGSAWGGPSTVEEHSSTVPVSEFPDMPDGAKPETDDSEAARSFPSVQPVEMRGPASLPGGLEGAE